MAKNSPLHPQTITAQALGEVDPETFAVSPALHPSTTYLREESGADRRYSYSRADNPTYTQCEALLSELEEGAQSLLFSSGMAAALAAFQALPPGSRIIAGTGMYWSLRNWLKNEAPKNGLEVAFIPTADLTALEKVLQSAPAAMVWLETPANPMWEVTDIAAAADICHRHGALLAIDSTVATPVLTRPLCLGADLVMHSATKYLNGHSDVIAGSLTCRRNDDFWQQVRANRANGGAVLGPFEAWLLLRGMRTLHIRVQTACQNAMKIARHFNGHKKIAAVLYPGLPDHPGHDIAARQMQGGFSGMLSIRLKEGEEAARLTAARTQLWKRATSLGGVESLIEHRAPVEGPGTPVPYDLLRLSVGIENADDLIADLESAMA